MISFRFGMRVDGSAIREIERSVCGSFGLGFSRIENQGEYEDEKLYLHPGKR